MKFYMPARLYQEPEAVRRHGREISGLGRKALLVTGACSAKKNGSQADLLAVLTDAGVDYLVFDEVEENPSTETVMRACRSARAAGCDFVVGIGGGSPLDAAKAIALMLAHPDWGEEKLYEKGPDSRRLPLVCIPTTCGTGSELTGVAVLTRRARGLKGSIPYSLFPDLALVDGKYLAYAPKRLIANTATDALAHLIEAYANRRADDYSRMLVDEGLAVWAENKDFLLGEEEASPRRYDRLMLASSLAGMSIAQSGTTLPHGLSYQLTLEGGIPHGAAVGYFQAAYLEACDRKTRDHLLEMAGFESPEELDDFFRKICRWPEVSQELLEDCLAAVKKTPAKLDLCPFDVNEEVLRRIAGLDKGEKDGAKKLHDNPLLS